MLDIESWIKAKRVMCLKKFLRDYPSSWKTILGKILSPVRRRFLLYCNLDTAELKIPLPAYYKECLYGCSKLNRENTQLKLSGIGFFALTKCPYTEMI